MNLLTSRASHGAQVHGLGRRTSRDRTALTRGPVGLVAALALTGLVSGASGATGAVHVADLVYTEAPTAFINLGLSTTPLAAPFAKTPARSAQSLEGMFPLGTAETKAIAFLWDRRAGKLYLDLNRNLDLTDDTNGVFTTPRGYSGRYQPFNLLRLPLATSVGEQTLVADLTLWGAAGPPSGWLALRSFWRGKVTLQGQEWEVGLLPGDVARLDPAQAQWLLLRPWARREQPFTVHSGSLEVVHFARRLFLNGQGYALRVTNGPATLQLQFQEEQPPLAQARITGRFVHRLVLHGPWLVVLDQPEAEIQVPPGAYAEPQVCLRSGEVAAYLKSDRSPTERRLTIGDASPTELRLGGPLTNSISFTRRGATLVLNYELLGEGGRAYTRLNPDHLKPPRWRAVRNGLEVGSGKFEYG